MSGGVLQRNGEVKLCKRSYPHFQNLTQAAHSPPNQQQLSSRAPSWFQSIYVQVQQCLFVVRRYSMEGHRIGIKQAFRGRRCSCMVCVIVCCHYWCGFSFSRGTIYMYVMVLVHIWVAIAWDGIRLGSGSAQSMVYIGMFGIFGWTRRQMRQHTNFE